MWSVHRPVFHTIHGYCSSLLPTYRCTRPHNSVQIKVIHWNFADDVLEAEHPGNVYSSFLFLCLKLLFLCPFLCLFLSLCPFPFPSLCLFLSLYQTFLLEHLYFFYHSYHHRWRVIIRLIWKYRGFSSNWFA